MSSPRSTRSLRLAAFPLAYGLTGALVGGTLNRVMIADLGLPASLVATVFAIPLILAPVRVWFGHRSDTVTLLGRRRVPYLVAGVLLAGLGVLAVVQVTVRLHAQPGVLAALLALAFLGYGLGRALAHNSFQALVADRFGEVARGRAMTAYEVVTLVGSVLGASALAKAMEHYEAGRLVTVSIGVVVVVLLLTALAAACQEGRAGGRPTAAATTTQPAQDADASLAIAQVVRRFVIGDPQARRFFVVVALVFVGTLAQDVVLEPFAGQVLGLPVGDTTRLTAFWGVGVLVAMLTCAAVLLRKLGRATVLRWGIGVSVLAFVALVAVALTGAAGALRPVVLVMGLGTGLAGAGMLASVVAFTTPQRAGLLLGVWAVANMLGHATGSVLGGIVVDVVRAVTGSVTAAYVSVFALEVAALVVALGLLRRVDIGRSRAARDVVGQPVAAG